MSEADRAGTAAARDPGLQAERTALAWSRTALALLANGLLVLRAGWVGGRTAITLFALALLVCAAVTFAYGLLRRRELVGSTRPPRAPRPQVIGATASIALTACAVGLASILVSCGETTSGRAP